MKKTILIVEDEPKNLKLVKDLMVIFEYNTMEARTGAEAIKILENNYKTIDLVLMDIQMPVMDGLTAVQILKENEQIKHIPIIALTALAMKDDKEKFINAGFDDYIKKPIDIREFKKVVSDYLERRISI
ncbi:MAG: response regulator [Tepidibacter sp.]|jgi:CheY-like chemotaxis protein|uniref:response regulator n=1 Tax=Tepidibacter sp. TaxID=2529387 RepID=UPI0025FDB1CE|nr:response regulator [Tepidibacter sp.]MCT4509997.1 response regulator [Tepidibacter sp.]